MKITLSRFIVLTLSLALFFGLAARTQAAPIDLLRDAYHKLAEADHDYKGHRMDAMKQIEAAAKELGVDFSGEGKGHEKQGVSDEHLKEAQSLLAQAKTGLSGKPLKHVNKAEKELTIALKIK